MIGYLKGKVIHRGENFVTICCGDIGYKVFVDRALTGQNELELFVYHNIREDASELFGFERSGDLEVFELLLGVSGVGPRVALAIVSGLGRDKIISAIKRGETTLFKSISGVGNKVAAKIIVDLKSKVTSGANEFILPVDDEVADALVGLGYKKSEILPHLQKMPENLVTTQDKVKYVLRNAGKSKN